MPTPQIFPDSIINTSTEGMIAEFRKTFSVIYLTVLVVVVLAFVSLFFIRVQIGVRASGMVKPQGERKLLTAPIAGRLVAVQLGENLSVRQGDTLFVIDSRSITAHLPALKRRMQELSEMLADLRTLTRAEHGAAPTGDRLTNPVYKQAYHSYTAQLNDHRHKEQVAQVNHSRNQSLYSSGVIAQAEFEQTQAEANNAELSRRAFSSNALAQWQSDLNRYENEWRDLAAQVEQIDIQRNEAVVTAPTSGAIQSIVQVADGMFVHAGQQITELSPDGQLIAECAVATKDIGFVYVGQKARIRIDAFDYNIWGVMEGEVAVIFDDIVPGQTPYYRIYCALPSSYLTLKNGRKDYIKKGMTLNAHLIATERTVFQLIYDKADKWLNPNLNGNE